MSAAVSYASHRHGVIAFAVRTPTRSWGWHATRVFHSASVLKAMLLVAGGADAMAERNGRQQQRGGERHRHESRHGSNPRNSPWWKSTWHSSQECGIGR